MSRSRSTSSVCKGLPMKGFGGYAGLRATMGDVTNSADWGSRSTSQV